MRSLSSFSLLIGTGMIATAVSLGPSLLMSPQSTPETQLDGAIDAPTEVLVSRYRDRGSRGTGRREIMTHRSVAFVA